MPKNKPNLDYFFRVMNTIIASIPRNTLRIIAAPTIRIANSVEPTPAAINIVLPLISVASHIVAGRCVASNPRIDIAARCPWAGVV